MILFPMLTISVLLTRNAKIASVFLQVATAIPIHQTQIPSVRSISFANSVNAYSKVVIVTKAYLMPMIFVPENRNARSVNVSRKAASVIPTLSILMSSAPGMSSASTVSVSHSAVTATSMLLILTAFVFLERFARIASVSPPWPPAVSVTLALRMLMTSAEWMRGVLVTVSVKTVPSQDRAEATGSLRGTRSSTPLSPS